MNSGFSIWIKFLLLLILLWLGGFFFYIKEITANRYVQDRQADGIVILTGTAGRLKQGIDLLQSGAAKRLLVSGVNIQVTQEDLRNVMQVSETLMNCCIDIGRRALDTVGNAYETSLWATEHRFHRLLIVTSAYHMPRSLVELKREMPEKELFAVAPESDFRELQNWWKKPKLVYVLASEFNKYFISLIRARTESLVMDGV